MKMNQKIAKDLLFHCALRNEQNFYSTLEKLKEFSFFKSVSSHLSFLYFLYIHN